MPESTRSVLAGKNQLSAVSWRRPQNGTSFWRLNPDCWVSLNIVEYYWCFAFRLIKADYSPPLHYGMSQIPMLQCQVRFGAAVSMIFEDQVQLKWRQKSYGIMLYFQLWKHCRTFSLACLPLGFCEFFLENSRMNWLSWQARKKAL